MAEHFDNHRRIFDMGGAVFVGTLQLQHDLAGAITFEPFIGDGRPGDIGARKAKCMIAKSNG
jgi:hypothetical protein